MLTTYRELSVFKKDGQQLDLMSVTMAMLNRLVLRGSVSEFHPIMGQGRPRNVGISLFCGENSGDDGHARFMRMRYFHALGGGAPDIAMEFWSEHKWINHAVKNTTSRWLAESRPWFVKDEIVITGAQHRKISPNLRYIREPLVGMWTVLSQYVPPLMSENTRVIHVACARLEAFLNAQDTELDRALNVINERLVTSPMEENPVAI